MYFWYIPESVKKLKEKSVNKHYFRDITDTYVVNRASLTYFGKGTLHQTIGLSQP
jgi:hypothetical protein